MTENPPPYGTVSTTEELGQLVRSHRKQKQLTLENTSGLANLSVRFLSEFERGKETAEIGKVLKALRTLGLEVCIQPRNHGIRTSSQTSHASTEESPHAQGSEQVGGEQTEQEQRSMK